MSQEENRGLSQRYLQCDLLIIDDLGTEMTTQFVCSALYHVVNTRLMESRPTIISTNLTPEQLSVRYSPTDRLAPARHLPSDPVRRAGYPAVLTF